MHWRSQISTKTPIHLFLLQSPKMTRIRTVALFLLYLLNLLVLYAPCAVSFFLYLRERGAPDYSDFVYFTAIGATVSTTYLAVFSTHVALGNPLTETFAICLVLTINAAECQTV